MAGLNHLLEWIQFRLDTTNFFFDKPKSEYQPLPWIGINDSKIRGEVTIKRWKAIKQYIPKGSKTLKDIGSCVGYFCIAASSELSLLSLGIDANDRYIRIARYATPAELNDRCNFIKLLIDRESADFLPSSDITLCLSIWHHWVYDYGIIEATAILNKIWSTTKKVLFFESGEEEVADEFNIPFTKSKPAKEWLYDYLAQNLKKSKINAIGNFEAGDYSHYKIKNNKRTLFKIIRI
jgi:hypothetical protein